MVSRYLLAAAAVFVAVGVVVAFTFQTFVPPALTWAVLLALFALLVLLVSRAYTRRWLGLIIDDRNKYSLSRLQMVLWTVIVLSAFLAAVLANVQLQIMVYINGAVEPPRVLYFPVGARVVDALTVIGLVDPNYTEGEGYLASTEVDLSQINLADTLRDGQQIYVPRAGEPLPQVLPDENPETLRTAAQPTTPLSVQIPSEVWLLLGISTTSLVASPLIKSQKSNTIQKNEVRAEARLADLFTGEEDSNYMQLDLAKVQMLFFTLIVIGAYAVAVASMFNAATLSAITSLPALDGGVIALLGVSHAGYLTNKAVPKPGSESVEASSKPAGGSPPPAPAAPTIVIAQNAPVVQAPPSLPDIQAEPPGSVG